MRRLTAEDNKMLRRFLFGAVPALLAAPVVAKAATDREYCAMSGEALKPEPDWKSGEILELEKPVIHYLEIREAEVPVLTIKQGGVIEFGPGYTADEACRKAVEILGREMDRQWAGKVLS